MWMRVAVICTVLSLGLVGCTSKPVADTKIPQQEVGRKNPVESNPSSIAEGKRLYEATDCALCHAKDGDGKGVLAKDISMMKTHDWRQASSLDHFTDGELSYLILKGKGRMPAYANRESQEQVWQMVNYIRSMVVRGNSPAS